MSIIPSDVSHSQFRPYSSRSSEPVEEFGQFTPFITQQICTTVSESIIFPLCRNCYTISHDLIRLCRTVCTVQNIISHPVQSAAVGFLLYSDLFGVRTIVFQGAAAVVVISAVEEYLHTINGIATLKQGCLKAMELSKTLGKCQANTVPLLSYAEKSVILLSRKTFFISKDLYTVLGAPERLRTDVEAICTIAREELIDALKTAGKEQSSTSNTTAPPKANPDQLLLEQPNFPIALPVTARLQIESGEDIRRAPSPSLLSQISGASSTGYEYISSLFSPSTGSSSTNTQKGEESKTSPAPEETQSDKKQSEPTLPIEQLPPSAVETKSPSDETAPTATSDVDNRLNYFSFLTKNVKYVYELSTESVSYYTQEGINKTFSLGSSALQGVLKTKDYALKGVSKTMASAYSIGEKLIYSTGTTALGYTADKMLKNAKASAAKEIEEAEKLMANNILATTAHIAFSTIFSGIAQLSLPYLVLEQAIVLMPLPLEPEEQKKWARTAALVITVVGNLVWIRRSFPSTEKLNHSYQKHFDTETNHLQVQFRQLIPSELNSLIEGPQSIKIKVIRGINDDYIFYAKKIGITVENYQRNFFERIRRQYEGFDFPTEPQPAQSFRSSVIIEEIDDTQELLILRSKAKEE